MEIEDIQPELDDVVSKFKEIQMFSYHPFTSVKKIGELYEKMAALVTAYDAAS